MTATGYRLPAGVGNNVGNPDNNISTATAGVITTPDDGRATQFGLRFAW